MENCVTRSLATTEFIDILLAINKSDFQDEGM